MAKKLKLSANNIVTCVLYALIGILLIAFRSGSLNILFTIMGVLFLIVGIYDLITKQWIRGIVESVVGVAILVCGWTIAEWALLIFGILLIIKGVLDIISNRKRGWKALISPIVMLVIGIVLVISKFALIDVMCIIAGVIFLLNAVLALFGEKLA
ncbi:MAG: DUF308 domain-containing protein [Corallococcus sp.]|nr:DUF308 domain-containing protein [Bacillota bacterium]MCM1533601.1 DUF308 domain-containing protein [Corallococcus sp.]